MTSASSRSVFSSGLPRFTGRCSLDSARSTIPRMRSSTKQKLRVCEPSPNTVTGLPSSDWRKKVGIARPSFARIRGPYMLKIRTIAVFTPC